MMIKKENLFLLQKEKWKEENLQNKEGDYLLEWLYFTVYLIYKNIYYF